MEACNLLHFDGMHRGKYQKLVKLSGSGCAGGHVFCHVTERRDPDVNLEFLNCSTPQIVSHAVYVAKTGNGIQNVGRKDSLWRKPGKHD